MLIRCAILSIFGYTIAADPLLGSKVTACSHEFVLLESAGRGSYGRVFKAQVSATKEIFAIKMLKTETKKQMMLFEREVKAMERVKGHKHAVQLECAESRDSMGFIVMEFCNGGNLRFALRELTRTQGLKYWNQMAQGLEDMHTSGLFHRDLKPENVFLHNDQLKIGDFGLAIPTGIYNSGYKGSRHYAAPEMLTSKPYAESADLWSAGILFYEVFQKEHPYYPNRTGWAKLDLKQVKEAMEEFIRTKSELRSRMNPKVADILYGLLHETPSSRQIVRATWIPIDFSWIFRAA